MQDGATYWPDATWRTANPEQVGIDASLIQRFDERVASGRWRGVDSLLIIRHGYLVIERYYIPSSREHVHTMQSVSKSVTSLLAGTLVDAGRLALETPVLEALPQYRDLATTDRRKTAITLDHLLQMRSGIDFFESPYEGSPLERLNNSRGDWVRIALDLPMNADPGAIWQYNSGGVIALGAALSRVSGAPLPDLANELLFAPVGVSSARWVLSSYNSTAHAGGGLHLTALDLARIGYLVLREGRWKNQQVISRAWISRSATPTTLQASRILGLRPTAYGHLWWLLPLDSARPLRYPDNVALVAAGNLNQFLLVIPAQDLVVVSTGSSNGPWPAAVDFVMGELLPALRDQ